MSYVAINEGFKELANMIRSHDIDSRFFLFFWGGGVGGGGGVLRYIIDGSATEAIILG